MRDSRSVWAELVQAVDKPLGFYVLALLIVEAFLTAALLGADLGPEEKLYVIRIGIGVFILVSAFVGFCVLFKPRNLMYDKYAHLINSGKIPYGTNIEQISFHQLQESPQSREGR